MNRNKTTNWYQLSVEDVEKKLNTNIQKGLTESKVFVRQKKYGKNVLKDGKKETFADRIIKQLKSPLVFILIIAGLGTFLLQEYLDTLVIVVAVSINVIIGVFQEKRASSAFEKLIESQEKYATVIRDGKKIVINTSELVPGDIVVIEAGMYIPADVRIIKQNNLSVNEAALTGEWVSVVKDEKEIEKETHITGQLNMAWMGTLVSTGTAIGIVVRTGNKTQIGSVAKKLTYTEETQTPLQKSIKKLAKFLANFTLVSVAVIILIGIFRGESISEMLLIAIALAVAVMPEGLPAAVTVVLALGMESILKRGGLVRNLLAAETLGSTTTILTDKTGTLTMAEMRVASVVTLNSLKTIEKKGKGGFLNVEDEREVLNMAILTSDAFVEGKEKALAEWVVRGRPVERAMILAGLDLGITQQDLLNMYPRLDFLPFESKRRFVSSLHKIKKTKTNRMYLSGAPEVLLENAKFVYSDGKKIRLTQTIREKLEHAQKEKSSEGLRVIGIAYKETKDSYIPKKDTDGNKLFKDLVFSGFIVLHDPLRPDVVESIEIAKNAGARVIMLTGDNPVTAEKIATEAGIKRKDTKVLTGEDIEKYDDSKLLEVIEHTDVFARVLPDQKLRITRLLKLSGHVVAMTGDGINDAPALRSADIGIALGSGTEVAKEASDVILLNNSFSIIVAAIEEGRRILSNLKKIVVYLLSTGFSEIFIVGSALIAGTALPLLPAQILWVNILQEGFMNFAFAFEPKESGLMQQDPRSSAMTNILTPNLKKLITLIAVVTGILLVLLYFFLLYLDIPIEEIRTLIFIALSLSSLFFSFSIKNLHKPIWKINIFSNKYLLASLSISTIMLIAALVIPPLQKLLSLTTPSLFEFSIILILGLFNLFVIEIIKYITFERKKI